ncbi:hypothetical protein BC936DRAFT_139547 [Jimgerdemannia flammicorona]|uniref:Obg-like GTPase YGR210-like G4 motif-containing domain-containing protein n=1 Tax=Jimgerdemannia flammicorona TaxID=994334 RepID=A0A433B9M1_9FUNG|nr:hypothetical protein BC936DRAFT_139547 [Jimgerdemannia flammicorona]
MDKLDIKEPLETWDDEMLNKVVSGFLDERFPTVVAMNKIDLADSDKNISKIMRKYDQTKLVLTSALAENFLKKMQKQGYIKYIEGTDIVETKEELPDSDLKPMDEKLRGFGAIPVWLDWRARCFSSSRRSVGHDRRVPREEPE